MATCAHLTPSCDSFLLDLCTLVSVPSMCVSTTQAALGSCSFGTGTKASTHARTHTLPTHARLSSQLLSLSLLSGPQNCAPTTQAALVSSRRRRGRQARARNHTRTPRAHCTRFPRRARPSSQLLVGLRHVRRHTQRPTPMGEKKWTFGPKHARRKVGRTSHRGTSSRWTSA
jgi:hypothetical protein